MNKEDIESYIGKIMNGINSSVDTSTSAYDVDSQKLVQNLAETIGEIYMNGFKDGIDSAKKVLK